MTLSQRVALILSSDTGTNLQDWERSRLRAWASLDEAGYHYKPRIVADRIGMRLFGRDTWVSMVGVVHER